MVKILTSILGGLIALLVLGMATLVIYVQTTKPAVPDFEQFKADYTAQNSPQNFHWTPIENFSPALLQIFTRQYPDFGARANSLPHTISSSLCNLPLLVFIDPKGERLKSDWPLSSVSRGLINFYKLPVRPGTPAPALQVLHSCAFTKSLENIWSKDQIIETYFNIQFYGYGLSGIGSTSQVLFDKLPAQLNLIEASILNVSTGSPASFAMLPVDEAAQQVCTSLHRLNLPDVEQQCAALPQIIQTRYQRGRQHMQQLRE